MAETDELDDLELTDEERERRRAAAAPKEAIGKPLPPVGANNAPAGTPSAGNAIPTPPPTGAVGVFPNPETENRPLGGELTPPAAPSIGTPLTPPAQPHARPNYDEYQRLLNTPAAVTQKHGLGGALLKGLDIAGSIVAPGQMTLVPGTRLHHIAEVNRAARAAGTENQEITGESEEALRSAQTEEQQALAAKNRQPPVKHVPEVIAGPNGEPIAVGYDPVNNQYIDPTTQQPIPNAKRWERPVQPNQEQNKLDFQSVVGALDKAGLPTDPKSLPSSLDKGLKTGAITQEQHQKASAYLAANPTPSTNVQVHVAGAEANQEIKDANTWYHWSDASGEHEAKGSRVPHGVEAIPIGSDKDYAQHHREGIAANIVQQSLNRIAQDIDEHPELFDNATARNIMATTLEQIDRASAGILVAGTGGSIPLPSGLGDMINTALQNKALDEKIAAALKQYIADYKAMKDKGIVQQMEMQGGKIGRGSQQVFASIIDQIPNGKTADSVTARRQIANMQATQDQLAKQYAGITEKPYKFKAQTPPTVGGDMEYGTWRGQRVQRPKGGNGLWAPVPAQQ